MTIVPRGMFLLDGKLVRKPRLWPGRDRGAEVWFCGYKENLRGVCVAPDAEVAFELWAQTMRPALNGWSKL